MPTCEPVEVKPLPAFRVLFFNVANGLLAPDRLKQALEQSQADVIGLAELTSIQAGAVSDLKEIYPYQYLHGAGIPGKGLLSKVPMRGAELVELHPQRPDLRAYITLGADSDAQEVQVIVAHPPPQRTRFRGEQIRRLLELAIGGESTLLMGDFNMVQAQEAYRRYAAAGLIDAFRAAGTGRGLTYPVRRGGFRLRPMLRIDYIWHTRHLRAQRTWLGSDYGSDHLPIFAELTT
jgi:vancomycin resistance protein VanJ